MRDFFSDFFFPGPALAVVGIFVGGVSYIGFDALSQASVELGLATPQALPGLVGILAVMIGFAGLLCTIFRNRF